MYIYTHTSLSLYIYMYIYIYICTYAHTLQYITSHFAGVLAEAQHVRRPLAGREELLYIYIYMYTHTLIITYIYIYV